MISSESPIEVDILNAVHLRAFQGIVNEFSNVLKYLEKYNAIGMHQ